MRTVRLLAALAAATAVWIGAADPAAAKGPKEATLTGPGIDEPVVIHISGDATIDASGASFHLGLALTDMTSVYVWPSETSQTSAPDGDLGAKYTLTWTMLAPSDIDPEDYEVVQELYPSTPSGPWIHTLSSPATMTHEGWYMAADEMPAILGALGEQDTPRMKPASTSSSGGSLALWPPTVASAVAFTAGVVVGRNRIARIRQGGLRPYRQ